MEIKEGVISCQLSPSLVCLAHYRWVDDARSLDASWSSACVRLVAWGRRGLSLCDFDAPPKQNWSHSLHLVIHSSSERIWPTKWSTSVVVCNRPLYCLYLNIDKDCFCVCIITMFLGQHSYPRSCLPRYSSAFRTFLGKVVFIFILSCNPFFFLGCFRGHHFSLSDLFVVHVYVLTYSTYNTFTTIETTSSETI